ncbi:RGS1-HXK1-interacting protein 1 isoform X1 [Dioscorea cayenensis subsp. rotundata]|uniref:RGS1-HXK1-interacting protein 1 isoform X1 n=1 Tax=Dioscorea cayennensis subsp. rotundata TaxID=55577 RepID=A0AB40D7V6_DIOCR|nr:RGS1-HXK1-interacting protein 1 isoform X1 [Dioscorea cayenensis subsp. rotundata]
MASPVPTSSSPEDSRPSNSRSWFSDLVVARSPPETRDWSLLKLQALIPQLRSEYQVYEDAFVEKVKDGLLIARENSGLVLGVGAAAGLLLLRGPRRFLFRQTLGRLQSEEARFVKAEKGLQELTESVGKLNTDVNKLIKSAKAGEEEMLHGGTKIKNTGKEIQRLLKSIYAVESEAIDIMDGLRALPGRSALRLRAEVASMASELKQKRTEMNKKIMEIADLGIKV